METETAIAAKSANTSQGKAPSQEPGKSGNLLTRADFGLYVTGRVDSVSEVNHRQGKSEKGKEYSFWQQTATLALGGQLVEVVFRADSEPKGILCAFHLDEIIRCKVENPRIFNGKVSFDSAK